MWLSLHCRKRTLILYREPSVTKSFSSYWEQKKTNHLWVVENLEKVVHHTFKQFKGVKTIPFLLMRSPLKNSVCIPLSWNLQNDSLLEKLTLVLGILILFIPMLFAVTRPGMDVSCQALESNHAPSKHKISFNAVLHWGPDEIDKTINLIT